MAGSPPATASCNDVFKALDKIDCMVPINLDAGLGPWGMIADLYYARLEECMQEGQMRADPESTQMILEMAGFYRLGTWPLRPPRLRQHRAACF